MRQDFTYAWRRLRRDPTFALTAIFTLAIGIGATTAIFSVVHAVLLAPLTYPQPDRLVRLTGGATHTRFAALRAAHSYVAVAASNVFLDTIALATEHGPEPLRSVRVSDSYAAALGITLVKGRAFLPEEESRGLPVAMIAADLWRNRFHSRPDILGSTLTLGGVPHTIVGVLPDGLQLPFPQLDVWRPFDLDPSPVRRNSPILNVIGRLRPGVGVDQASAELTVINRQYANANPTALDARPATLREAVLPLQESLVRDVRSTLWTLFGAVTLVLLMACANVAGLILARSAARAREFAVRAALGASRRQLIRQQMVESLLLALAGGVLAIALAWASLGAVSRLPGLELPRHAGLRLNGEVLAFALGAALLTSLLFGLAPSLHTSRPDLASTIKGTAEAHARWLFWRSPRGWLVAAQVALTLVLLIGAGLLLESLNRLGRVPPGFEPHHLLTMQINVSPERQDELIRRVEAIPGVRAAAVTLTLPLTGFTGTPIQRADQPLLKLNERLLSVLQLVTPGSFRTLGIPLRQGRDIAATDTATSPLVTVVNEALARQFWGKDSPLGRRILIGTNPNPVEVVGVVADVHQVSLGEAPEPALYRPRTQFSLQRAMFAVRTASDPLTLAEPIRQELARVDPTQAVTSIRSMDALVQESEDQRRSLTTLLGIFASAGVLLVTVGIYGIIASTVTRRTREVGIRRALGASPGSVLRLILRQGIGLAAAGILLGVVVSVAATRLLTSYLYQVTATDPFTYTGAGLLLLLIAAVATYLPARRVLRIEPAAALRTD